ncbi:uncharacterized protein PSFLO_06983 [Pseudozyma flocculosa]|uniref:Uncharacterized protein n=1 Tax=Pseudozyma flocculosa TaxID=84751 RepID=A0A5C3FDF9_9BASI|nr:uncharacterized protein PSFLO_06983 [Pseudozyma flocculosa]
MHRSDRVQHNVTPVKPHPHDGDAPRTSNLFDEPPSVAAWPWPAVGLARLLWHRLACVERAECGHPTERLGERRRTTSDNVLDLSLFGVLESTEIPATAGHWGARHATRGQG